MHPEVRRDRQDRQACLTVASVWLQKIDCEDASDGDLHDWLAWCDRSTENRQSFEAVQALRRKLRELPDEYRALLRADAGIDARHSARFEAVRPGRGRKSWLMAAAILLAAGGGVLWHYLLPGAEHYVTARAEHRTVTLSDGSQAVIGADSAIEVVYDEDRRLINVHRGEAYLEVRPDPSRPFVVQAGAVGVTAVGTAFNVERGRERVTVAVIDGAVNIHCASGPIEALRLAAGERAVLRTYGKTETGGCAGRPEVSVVDPAAVIAWQQGQLHFAAEPLAVVLESVNRYARREVVVGDPQVAAMSYTGVVLREHMEEWIDNLPLVFPLEITRLKNGAVVLLADPVR